jgi:hypothetical protein
MTGLLGEFRRDLVYAARRLQSAPAFALFSVVSATLRICSRQLVDSH